VKDFEDRQTTTQDMLTKIAQLRHEQEEARAAALKSGLGAQGFNVLWTFTQQKVPKADEIAQVVDAAVTEHPHWQSNEDLAREFRMSLYLTLDDLTDDVPGMVERIFKVLGR
ncbi:MAG: hypothetical protein KA978_27420, partial [Deltaproteobacteria bacterium]|nr:hypothetical protein [Deltaproteobacteria bacterium]